MVVDKPAGWTSHQVVGKLRRVLDTRKVGHAGTLDPMATGVLLVGVNKATRLLGHLMLTHKTYLGTVRLGESTVTDDAEGELVTSTDAAGLHDDQIRAATGEFRGVIAQIPTAFSAIKVNGVRSYARARAGEEVELAARQVTISRYELTAFRRSQVDGRTVVDLDIEVDCSSGTYIRALARDLGRVLGVGGHLTRLRRTRVGPFGLDRAEPVDPDTDQVTMIDISAVARATFRCVDLDPAAAADVRFGRRISLPATNAAVTAVFDGDLFLALYRPDGRPEAVFV